MDWNLREGPRRMAVSEEERPLSTLALFCHMTPPPIMVEDPCLVPKRCHQHALKIPVSRTELKKPLFFL